MRRHVIAFCGRLEAVELQEGTVDVRGSGWKASQNKSATKGLIISRG